MTTEKRLEKLERELAAAKQINRWKLTAIVLAASLLCMVAKEGFFMTPANAGDVESIEHINSDRYMMIPSGENGIVYRLDKRTGKSWVIIGIGEREFLVDSSTQNMTAKEYRAAVNAKQLK